MKYDIKAVCQHAIKMEEDIHCSFTPAPANCWVFVCVIWSNVAEDRICVHHARRCPSDRRSNDCML